MKKFVTAPSEARLITGEELLAMGDIGPCELIDGRIVPMAPAGIQHGTIELNLGSALKQFVQQRELGWVAAGEVGIYTRRNPDRVRGADLVFISKGRLSSGLPQGFLEIAPELIVEILSPEDRWQNVRQKIEEYFAIGVERVWVVDPENRAVLVYRSNTEMRQLGEGDILKGEGILEGFTLPVASLFQ
ncbi:MAG: Uma2 family endonuclease [Anaerolineae bacterium]|nr:Uma2 family endonuclease [Anaerolineae bacterium]MDW8100446.1 Uma2 family endonuclease [Anaerolineae bacterium]